MKVMAGKCYSLMLVYSALVDDVLAWYWLIKDHLYMVIGNEHGMKPTLKPVNIKQSADDKKFDNTSII